MNNRMSSWEKVKDFYQLVIDDFGKRLSIRFAGRQQGFDTQIIDQMKKKLREKIQKPNDLFNAALQTKHSNNTSLITNTTKKDDIVKKEQNEMRQKNEEEEEDYLLMFKNLEDGDKPEGQGPFIKKQENSPAQQQHIEINPDAKQLEVKIEEKQQEPNINEIDEDRDDQEDRQKRRQTEALKKNLHLHIVGTYQPKSKKHIAKDESTKLELDDVLIKYRDASIGEMYCHKMICQFKKD